ncbi:MAG: hypothetical protein ACRENE_24940 [Polyangiaceae bacterium]
MRRVFLVVCLRLIANPIEVPAGGDVTHCQYLMAPLDRDMDVVDVAGSQSTLGHHDVAFSYAPQSGDKVGAEVKCMMDSTEFTSGGATRGASTQTLGGTFLGGAGPKGVVTKLPAGVAFRLQNGQGVVLNLHYINPGATPGMGHAYMDLKLAGVDPNRLIAALFTNINAAFDLPPSTATDSSVDCLAQSDGKLIMVANPCTSTGRTPVADRNGVGPIGSTLTHPSQHRLPPIGRLGAERLPACDPFFAT